MVNRRKPEPEPDGLTAKYDFPLYNLYSYTLIYVTFIQTLETIQYSILKK
jgi:hypothetical protein